MLYSLVHIYFSYSSQIMQQKATATQDSNPNPSQNQPSSLYNNIKKSSFFIYNKTKDVLSYAYQSARGATNALTPKLSEVYGKSKQKTKQVYDKSKQISKDSLEKGKQYSKNLYGKGKQYSSIAYEKTKNVSKQALQKGKEYGVAAYQGTKLMAVIATAYYKQQINSLEIQKTLGEIEDKKSSKYHLMQNIIDDLIYGALITSLASMGFSSKLSILGLKGIGLMKGALPALLQSKFGILGSKYIMTSINTLFAKSMLISYVPIVVPVVAITYTGYKIYVKVATKKQQQLKNNSKAKNIFEQQNSQKQIRTNAYHQNKIAENKIVNKIEVKSLDQVIRNFKHQHKNPQSTL